MLFTNRVLEDPFEFCDSLVLGKLLELHERNKTKPIYASLRDAETARVGKLSLMEKVIGNFYFEIGEIPGTSIFRVAAFVTATKPSITSNPIVNEAARIGALNEMFDRLRKLRDYKVEVEAAAPLTAQGSNVLVTGIRANVSKTDNSRLTFEDIVGLMEQGLVPRPL
jgi:hypothetical protein